MSRDPSGSSSAGGEAARLEAFFRALGEEARREYAALAELDRAFGEDVVAERRARQVERP
jgi:hypothetical protein